MVLNAPEILLDGNNERLSPGAKIRSAQRMLVMPATITGQNLLVNYKRDTAGMAARTGPHARRSGGRARVGRQAPVELLALRDEQRPTRRRQDAVRPVAALRRVTPPPAGNPAALPVGRVRAARTSTHSLRPFALDCAMTKKVFIKTFGCQMNEYDSDKMADVLTPPKASRQTTGRRRGRPDPVQHLLGAREGAGKGVQRPGPRQAPQEQGRADRRRRLRRQPGRCRDHQARAVCGRGVRPADAAPPARDARARERRQPPAGRHQLPRDREVRPPAARARGRRSRLRVDHGRLLQVLQLLRGALHPRRRGQPPVRGRAGRRSPDWPTRACARSTCWART